MKNMSGCVVQIVSFVVTLIVIHFLWAGWRLARSYFESQGAPFWMLQVGAFIFFLWTISAIVKWTIMLLMPKSINFVSSSVEKVSGATEKELQNRPPIVDPLNPASNALPLDSAKLQEYDSALQAMGFHPINDFSVESNRPLPPGFARLFVSEKHQCRAELNQIFPQSLGATPTVMTCVFTSVLNSNTMENAERWTLETSNSKGHSGAGITWAMRRPRSIWSRHPDWTPAQLLSFHLERRAQMIQNLQLSVVTDLSWEGYCNDSNQTLKEQRTRLFRKLGFIIFLENTFCKKKTEWWGDFRKYLSAPKTAVPDVT
jgi:hypothetical protein